MKNPASSIDVGAARDTLTRDFQSLVSHAEDLLHATTSLSNEGVDMARQKLGDSLRQVKAQIGPVRDAALERGKLAVDTAVTFARDKPWQTAAVVCLAALTIGFIASLGSSKK